jgi:hypothetical protein
MVSACDGGKKKYDNSAGHHSSNLVWNLLDLKNGEQVKSVRSKFGNSFSVYVPPQKLEEMLESLQKSDVSMMCQPKLFHFHVQLWKDWEVGVVFTLRTWLRDNNLQKTTGFVRWRRSRKMYIRHVETEAGQIDICIWSNGWNGFMCIYLIGRNAFTWFTGEANPCRVTCCSVQCNCSLLDVNLSFLQEQITTCRKTMCESF